MLSLRYCFVVTQSSAQPPSDGALMQSVFPAGLGECQSLALYQELSVVSFVVGLLRNWRPLAILRTIRTLVVLPVERISAWALTHVSSERRWVVNPSLVHSDSTTSVVLKADVFTVVAPLFSCGPSEILARASQPMAEMTEPSPASAAIRSSAPQHISAKRLYSPANTPAFPPCFAVSNAVKFQNCQISEALTGEIHNAHGSQYTPMLNISG